MQYVAVATQEDDILLLCVCSHTELTQQPFTKPAKAKGFSFGRFQILPFPSENWQIAPYLLSLLFCHHKNPA